uniref:Uncharacterized protein n=1 Tax=Sphaerodactylus townsendi TaxID=933632 RepID=A0ACB8EKF9_9SAUR
MGARGLPGGGLSHLAWGTHLGGDFWPGQVFLELAKPECMLLSQISIDLQAVVIGALHAALLSKPVECEGEVLVEKPLVKQMPERVGKVRVPCGYGLLQAKEEAKKVRVLRRMMRNCITHMLFLLVVLAINYQSCFHDKNIHLLHAAVKQAITVTNDKGLNFTSVHSFSDMLGWIDSVLLNYLYINPRLKLVGVPRLQQQSSTGILTGGISGTAGEMGKLRKTRTRKKYVYMEVSQTNQVNGDMCSDPAQQDSFRTKAVFVEFTQYNSDVNLYVTVMLLFEFPSDRPAASSIYILPFQLLHFGNGLDLPLALVICLLLFSGTFLLPNLTSTSQERGPYLWKSHSCFQLLLTLLSIAVAALHFGYIHLTNVRLMHYQKHRQAFTSFYEVAVLAHLEATFCALLLTFTAMKIVQQMHFVRRWSVFGKTFQHALRELVATTVLFLLFLLICAQCGCLAFSLTVEEFQTLSSAFSALLSALHGKMPFLPSLIQASPIMGTVYVLSYGVSVLWIGQSFLCASIVHSYRIVRSEIYHPVVGPQAYEMIEFLVKRFKWWMGFSKMKEFRHKVKFEGMDSLISHSSGISKPSRLSSPGTNFRCTSATISSFSSEELVLPESPGCDPCSTDFYLGHLPLAVNDLLDHFDRILKLLEDVCQLETSLEKTQRRMNQQRPKKNLPEERVVPLASTARLGLPRTYSAFSESALARLRAHQVRISSCSASEGSKLYARDIAPEQRSGFKAQLGSAPATGNFCPGTSAPWPSHLFKRRPKSEEGQGSQSSEVLQRQIPLKRRAWQTEGM